MLDELKMRYKELAFGKRLAICLVAGLLPGIYVYFDESTIVDEEYAEAETLEKAAADKLLAAENQLKNLQKTQGELEFTRDQLKKAESRLPDQIVIDEILRTMGKTSREMGVKVRVFEPKEEIIRGDEYKYSELPIRVAIEAHEYSVICEWIDKIAGSKSKIYLRSWKLGRSTPKGVRSPISTAPADSVNSQGLNSADIEAQAARDELVVTIDADFSLFKMATPEQIAGAALKEQDKAKDPGKKSGPKLPEVAPQDGAKDGAG